MSRRPLVIVGAGPAGMAAAIAAAEVGLRPLVLDENPQPGGQIYRQPPAPLKTDATAGRKAQAARGTALLRRFREHRSHIELLAGATVWGLFPHRRLAVTHNGTSLMIEAEHLILAPGAYEYLPPFPGWTLPGMMTPGGAQAMVKVMHVRPGRRALVAGTGPFLLVVAEQLHRAGMQVAGVVEMASTGESIRALPGMLADIGLLGEGLRYLYRLRRARIPIHWGHVLIEARGEREVREAIFAPCDREGRPDRGRARAVEVDTVCAGYGFVPRTQLAQLGGCRLRFDDALGGWIPERTEELQTSVPGVWVAGDGAGVAGALVAELEGSLAGLAVARHLGALEHAEFQRKSQPLVRRLAKLRRFRAVLDRLYRIRPGLTTLATDETIVCRCEELTRAEVEAGIAAGGMNIRTQKVITRLGMGPCQGLMCWPAAARLIAARTGQPVEAAGPLSVRPPITPVCLGDLCEGAGGEPEQAVGEVDKGLRAWGGAERTAGDVDQDSLRSAPATPEHAEGGGMSP